MTAQPGGRPQSWLAGVSLWAGLALFAGCQERLPPTAPAPPAVPEPAPTPPVVMVPAPENLSAAASSSVIVSLSWDPVTGAPGYEFRWKETNEAWADDTPTVEVGGVTAHTHEGRSPGTAYHYQVRVAATAEAPAGPWSATAAVETPALEVPENLSAMADSSTAVTLRWDLVAAAVFYDLERMTVANIRSVVIPDVQPGYVDAEGVAGETVYEYRVRSVLTRGEVRWESRWSGRAEVTTPPAVPESARYPVVSQCEGVTILAGTPRRIDDRLHPRCGEEYAVDFVVEGGTEDAMLLDMFQSHTLWDWRPEVRGEDVRHEFTLRMAPGLVSHDTRLVPAKPGLRSHEPIVLQSCPGGEGEGPVLACTNRSCGMYDDVLEVPPLEPEDLEVAFTVPPEFLHTRPIQEGETVWVPVTYRVFRPLSKELTLRVGFGFGYLDPELAVPYVDGEVSPSEIRLPAGWTRTETRGLRLRVTRFDYEGFRKRLNRTSRLSVPVRLTLEPLEPPWDRDGCVNVPQSWVGFNLLEPE